MPSLDFTKITFSEPLYLWLLIVPAALGALWVRRFTTWRSEARRLSRLRVVPVRERFAMARDLPFWLCLIVATALLVLATARPHATTRAVRQGSVDIVILQDASASMRTKDAVGGDRWQRSMRFLRALGDALSWQKDRVALAVFAHIAAPQVRLTTDPNSFFFFLDHLNVPPFRLEDDTTWDTNLELGIAWGIRMIQRDEELHGKSQNAKLFVIVSDGELWSGAVDKSLTLARAREIPVFVVGVGSLGGGRMPAYRSPELEGIPGAFDELPRNSRLDREGLQRIAVAGRGQYFELDRDGDQRIANTIVDAGKRLAPVLGVHDEAEDLYWRCLCAAAIAAGLGLFFLRDRLELALQFAGGVLALVGLARLLG